MRKDLLSLCPKLTFVVGVLSACSASKETIQPPSTSTEAPPSNKSISQGAQAGSETAQNPVLTDSNPKNDNALETPQTPNLSLNDSARRKDYLTKLMQGEHLSLDQTFQRAIKDTTKVVLLGENHLFGAGKIGYASILKIIQENMPGFNCISFELNQSYQADLDMYSQGSLSAVEFNQKHAVAHNLPRWVLVTARPFIVSLRPALYAVDEEIGLIAKEAAHQKLPWDYTFIEKRNSGMAKRITELLENGQCKRLVHIGGMLHLTSSENKGMPLQTKLRARNVESVAIALISEAPLDLNNSVPEGIDASGVDVWNWPLENWNPTKYNEAYGLKPFSPSPSMLPKISSEIGYPLWEDFDSVLILPGG